MNEPVVVNRPHEDGDLLERALRESLGGRLAAAAGTVMSAAWTSSVSRGWLTSAVGGWRALPPPAGVRMAAAVGIIAVVVHRAMARLGAPEPLGAVVPAVVLVMCALTVLCADPIARALERMER